MVRFLWICLGGALGSGMRYLVSDWVLKLAGSSFPYETMQLMQEGDWGRALLNVVVTVVACLVACYAGLLVARGIVG